MIFSPTKMVSAMRVCKFKAPPKEMLLSFFIGTFLTNYDITNKKQQKALIYSIGGKTTFQSRNKSMETTLFNAEN